MFKWKRRKKSPVGLDIGASSVKVVELSQKGGEVTLVSLAQELLVPDAIIDGRIIELKDVSQALGKTLSDERSKTEQVVVAVGHHYSILKNIVVPLMSDEEWMESCDWHAEEHIPFDIADVVLDSQILARSENLEVLLGACKRELVDQLNLATATAGKKIAIVDFESLALVNCYLFNYEPAEDATAALLDIGAASMIISIVKGRRPAFTREVAFGGEHYTQHLQRDLGLSLEQAEEAKRSKGQELGIQGAEIKGVVEALSKALSLEAIINSVSEMLELEIRKTLDFYYATQDDHSTVQKILLSGGSSKLNGLAEFLSGRLEMEVESLDPFRRIEYDEGKFGPDEVKQVSPEMAVAVGLALRGVEGATTFNLNLLTYDEEKKRLESIAQQSSSEKTYRFKGRNRVGDIIIGERMAESRNALREMLRREGITLISKENVFKRLVPQSFSFRRKRVSVSELERFTRWFSFMIEAGAPLVLCLETLAEEEENEYFKQVLSAVLLEVERGSTLSEAMARHPKVFDKRYVNIVWAGETGGILDKVFTRLQSSFERELKWRRQVKRALLYPLTTLALMLLTLFAFISRQTNQSATADRLLTRIFTGIGAFLSGIGGIIILAFILMIVISLFILHKRERGRRRIDALLLRAPLIGGLLRKKGVARLSRTLYSLLSTGCPIMSSLEITAEEARNTVFTEAVNEIHSAVYRGQCFTDGMTNHNAFTYLDRTMLGMGEQYGCLDSSLSKLAEFYEKELEATMSELPFRVAPVFVVLYLLIIGLIFYYR